MLYITQSGSLTNQMGVPLALFAFVAVVVGGMGNLTGAVVGGFVLLGLIVTMLQAIFRRICEPSGMLSRSGSSFSF